MLLLLLLLLRHRLLLLRLLLLLHRLASLKSLLLLRKCRLSNRVIRFHYCHHHHHHHYYCYYHYHYHFLDAEGPLQVACLFPPLRPFSIVTSSMKYRLLAPLPLLCDALIERRVLASRARRMERPGSMTLFALPLPPAAESRALWRGRSFRPVPATYSRSFVLQGEKKEKSKTSCPNFRLNSSSWLGSLLLALAVPAACSSRVELCRATLLVGFLS